MSYRTGSNPQGTCPRCVVELERHDLRGMRADVCPRCGGVFADKEMSDAIHRQPDQALMEAIFAFSLGKRERPSEAMALSLGCPECGMAMRRVPIQAAACDIDVCDEHGTWFDAHEFHRAVRAGERSRERRRKR